MYKIWFSVKGVHGPLYVEVQAHLGQLLWDELSTRFDMISSRP